MSLLAKSGTLQDLYDLLSKQLYMLHEQRNMFVEEKQSAGRRGVLLNRLRAE